LPTVPRRSNGVSLSEEDGVRDAVDALEVFELIRHINDPEHPLTLEQLDVAKAEFITVDDARSTLDVRYKPTIPHCSMATLIGLCIRVKLIRSLPPRFKTTVRIEPGTHMQEESVSKQLNDKERVCAALENANLLEMVNRCLHKTDVV
jgi:metal-sulfur cluster biosynthetic enzyme